MALSGLEVRGLDQLAHLSHAMRAAGEQGKGLKRELGKELNRETKQTRKDMRAAIVPGLPQRGGLAADVLRSTRFTTSVSTGENVGVRIRATSKRSIRRMNATGAFRHPVFGRRDTWVTQIAGKPDKGFLDKPFIAAKPDLQRAVLVAIARIRDDLYRST
jgi:hypothetical protein